MKIFSNIPAAVVLAVLAASAPANAGARYLTPDGNVLEGVTEDAAGHLYRRLDRHRLHGAEKLSSDRGVNPQVFVPATGFQKNLHW
jgi:hypothetical protein